jgi:hypothetical protein
MNSLGGSGLWDEESGFYYDQLMRNGEIVRLRVRSLVGLIPLIAVEVLESEKLSRLPGFSKRMNWFLEHRGDLARHISYLVTAESGRHAHRLLAIPSLERLERRCGTCSTRTNCSRRTASDQFRESTLTSLSCSRQPTATCRSGTRRRI